MKPRILLLMDSTDQYHFIAVHGDRSPYTFVDYQGKFTEDSVRDFLQQHRGEYDAVAVFSINVYADVRETMERTFDGPKILLHSLLFGYEPPDGQYTMQVHFPVLPSKFDKLVEKHFKNL
jgi:hypothetical protein